MDGVSLNSNSYYIIWPHAVTGGIVVYLEKAKRSCSCCVPEAMSHRLKEGGVVQLCKM